MSTVFKGWIPNVSGALSFSTIGSGYYPSQPIRANLGDQKVRYIIAYQHRNLLDAIIPFYARLIGIQGNFVCLCLAKCSDDPLNFDDTMHGRLFIYDDQDFWKKNAKTKVIDAQQRLRAFIHVNGQSSTLENYFDSTYLHLLNQFPTTSSFFLDFELRRSGIATLTIPENYQQLISPNAPAFPVNQQEREHMERIVSSQLFFFLKDLAHNHQHHDPKLDTLVDIHPFNGNEEEWRSKTLRYLYRKIIEYKRNIRASNYHSSLGILIYAKSFRGISLKENKIEDLHPLIQDDLLEDAIKAGLQNTCFNQDDGKNPMSKISFYITVTTFVLTIAMLLSLTDFKVTDPDFVLKSLGTMLVKYTVPALCSAYVFYWTFNMKFDGKIDLSKAKASRTSLAILQPLNQIYAAMIPILIACIAVILCLYFLNTWYNFPLMGLVNSFFGHYKPALSWTIGLKS